MSNLENILSYAKDAFQSYNDEDMVSLEAEVLLAMLRCKGRMRGGRISTQEVANEFNLNRGVGEALKNQSVGRVIARLGFKPKRTVSGLGGWLYDSKTLKRMMQRYSITEDVSQGKIA